MNVLVIDNYDSFTYNLVHYLGDLGATLDVVRNDKTTTEEIARNRPDAIVLSPGPCTPLEAGITVDVITDLGSSIPIFGVCLGMQSIGQAFGGDVVRAPTLMHGKTSRINHEGKGVFKNIASGFVATRYHSLAVAPETMPEVLEVTATTDDGIVMGLQHRQFPVHGVQFHPESIASENGHAILQNFLDIAHAFNANRAG